jgi:hypothetical protein
MDAPAPQEADQAGLDRLPPELRARLLRLGDDIGTVRAARAASKALLREPGAAAVQGLVAQDGRLPRKAWQVFPQATGLTAVASRSCGGAQAFLARLLRLVPSLPARLQSLDIDAPDPEDWNMFADAHRRSEAALAAALTRSPCSATLQHIRIAPLWITAQVADALLLGLPSLRSVDLSLSYNEGQRAQAGGAALAAAMEAAAVGEEVDDEAMATLAMSIAAAGLAWRPQLQQLQHLTRLALFGLQHMTVDLQALSGLSQLRHLCVCALVSSWPCISSLSGLQGLQGGPNVGGMLQQLPLAPLGSLRQLQWLDMPNQSCSADEWAVLAALPKLERLRLGGSRVVLSDAASPAAVTHLEAAAGRLLEEVPEERLPGCLPRLLPWLEVLCVGRGDNPGQLLAALHGHPQLRELELVGPGDLPWGDLGGVLAQQPQLVLPALCKVVAHEVGPEDAGCVLQLFAAAAPALQHLHLGFRLRGAGEEEPSGVAQGLAALAAAPCSGCLEELHLVTGTLDHMRHGSSTKQAKAGVCSSPGELAALLQAAAAGGLPQLRVVEVRALALPDELFCKQEVEQQLPGLGAGWRCVCLDDPDKDKAGAWCAPCRLQRAP